MIRHGFTVCPEESLRHPIFLGYLPRSGVYAGTTTESHSEQYGPRLKAGDSRARMDGSARTVSIKKGPHRVRPRVIMNA